MVAADGFCLRDLPIQTIAGEKEKEIVAVVVCRRHRHHLGTQTNTSSWNCTVHLLAFLPQIAFNSINATLAHRLTHHEMYSYKKHRMYIDPHDVFYRSHTLALGSFTLFPLGLSVVALSIITISVIIAWEWLNLLSVWNVCVSVFGSRSVRNSLPLNCLSLVEFLICTVSHLRPLFRIIAHCHYRSLSIARISYWGATRDIRSLAVQSLARHNCFEPFESHENTKQIHKLPSYVCLFHGKIECETRDDIIWPLRPHMNGVRINVNIKIDFNRQVKRNGSL